MLAITSPVFEGMFFGPLADRNLREVRVEDVKPTGFKRLIHFIYNSRCLSWKIEDAEEWWHILEAANKYMNTRLVEQVERRLREIAKRDAGKGVILRHLTMANRYLTIMQVMLYCYIVDCTSVHFLFSNCEFS